MTLRLPRSCDSRRWTTILTLATFALVAGSARAEEAVVTTTVEYAHGDVTLEGVLSMVPSKTARPGVLVVHAWMGLNAQARDSAERLARMGYVALAVDVYGKGVRPTSPQEAGKEASKYKGDRALTRARIQAGLERLKKVPEVDSTRIGAIGYCFGGMVVLELARSGADVGGVVSFHGSLDTPTPDDMKAAKARVLVLHGADDPVVPQDAVAKFVAEMRASKVDWSLVQYGGAVHSFSDPEAKGDANAASRYDEKAARRAWAAMASFFEEAFARK